MHSLARYSAASLAVLAGLGLAGLGVAGIGLAWPQAAAAREAGVAAAVNADSLTRPPTEIERTLIVGHNVVFDEKITTGPKGQAQILMLDQSAVTVGPNSELVIDKFVYDPDKKTGEMAMTLSRGLMRFVGGRLSKSGDARIHTPVATMGIRGGIALINVISPTVVDVTLLYGDAIQGETQFGTPFELRRAGYFTRIEEGKGASEPKPAGAAVGEALAKLQGREGANGGAEEKPTDEDASAAIGDGALAGASTPQVDFKVDAVGKDVDASNLTDQDGGAGQINLPNNFFNETLLAFGAAKQGVAQFDVVARLLESVDPDGDKALVQGEPAGAQVIGPIDPDAFANGAGLFAITADTGRALVALANAGPLTFFEVSQAGFGDPDAVANIFDESDETTYLSPQTFNANTLATAGADGARIFEARNDKGDAFFNYDLSSADFDGVNGSRIAIFGGAPLATAPTGRTFFSAPGDSTTISFLPFSEIGRAQLPIGGGVANAAPIDPANAAATPVIVDWDRGKALYIGSVTQNLRGASASGDMVYGIQAFVGDVVQGAGKVEIVGSNAGSTHYEVNGVETRLFHGGAALGSPLGGAARDFALSLDGDHAALAHQDQNSVRQDPRVVTNHQFGVQTAPVFVNDAGTGVANLVMFAATIVADIDGNFATLATNPDIGGVGALVIDRDAGEVVANFKTENEAGGVVSFANPAGNSAFIDDRTYGVAVKDGATTPGLVVISQAAVSAPQPCVCAFVPWGLWAVGHNSPGEIGNLVSDVGAYFAGVPTPDIDMPISGSATYSGQAYASLLTPANATPAFATGAFTLNTNFAAGVSTGQMHLNDESFSVLGQHVRGNSVLTVDYINTGRIVGNGHGAFFGPQAQNVGVTIDIDNGAGLKAAGVAVGERR